jgi:hypothetical protein
MPWFLLRLDHEQPKSLDLLHKSKIRTPFALVGRSVRDFCKRSSEELAFLLPSNGNKHIKQRMVLRAVLSVYNYPKLIPTTENKKSGGYILEQLFLADTINQSIKSSLPKRLDQLTISHKITAFY